MTSQTRDLAEVVERLEKVERHLRVEKRRNRWLLATVGLGVVGLVLAWILGGTTTTAQAQGASSGLKEIRANRLILEDQNGKSRAELAVDKDGPRLVLTDQNGKIGATLNLDKDGSGLALLDETGKPRLSLDAFKSGPILNLHDQNGNSRAILEVTNAGPRLTLRDETGKPIWSQP